MKKSDKSGPAPLVSVLMPLYNAEKYLANSIESILNQTYKNIEIIIVNDGSTDNSLEIARTYEERHERIKVISQGNRGAASARNRAFSLSSGDYIQYLDADDLLHPDKIRLQIEALAYNRFDPCVISISRWYRFHNKIENFKEQELFIYKDYSIPKNILIDAWTKGHYSIINSWLTPRKLHEKTGGWDETISVLDDGVFFARLVMSSDKIIFVNKSIAYWRQDNLDSLSKRTSRKAMLSHLTAVERYKEIVENHLDDEQMCYALAMEYSRCLYRSYPRYIDIVKSAELAIRELGFSKPLLMPNKNFHLAVKLLGYYPSIRLFHMKHRLFRKLKKIKSDILWK